MHKFYVFTFKVDVHRTYFSLMNKVSYIALLFFPNSQWSNILNLFVSDLNVTFLYFKLFLYFFVYIYICTYICII